MAKIKFSINVLRLTLLLFFSLGVTPLIAQNKDISHYQVVFGIANYKNTDFLIIRKYNQGRKSFYIGVDLNELTTATLPAKKIQPKLLSWSQIITDYKDAPYIKALLTAKNQSVALQNAGISHGYPSEKGITLTIDLCPSHKPLDRVIFTSLIGEFKKTERPVPLALSITGRFMISHAEDINWLQKLEAHGDIDITWINHTYNHHYNPKIPLKENFLLEPGTDLNFEILGTEMAMLQKGMLFSVFFRFPGLVSSEKLVDSITNYGLIPIGSDAWLAKGQAAHNGTIVLIHGNGNEPLGVTDFISLLKKENTAVLHKQWLLYDLRETVEDEFEKE